MISVCELKKIRFASNLKNLGCLFFDSTITTKCVSGENINNVKDTHKLCTKHSLQNNKIQAQGFMVRDEKLCLSLFLSCQLMTNMTSTRCPDFHSRKKFYTCAVKFIRNPLNQDG